MTKLGNGNWTSNSENKLKSCVLFPPSLITLTNSPLEEGKNASANTRNKEMGLCSTFYKYQHRILMKKN